MFVCVCLCVCINRFEQAFVNSLIFGRSGDSFWIDLQDQKNTGSYRWEVGQAVSYTNWNRDQPCELNTHAYTDTHTHTNTHTHIYMHFIHS